MEFRLLGPMEVLHGAVQIPLPGREKERCLLAVLLMSAGQVLSKEKLISCVWDDPREVAEGTFRSYLNHAKRVIDATGGEAKLVSRDGGYQLLVPDDCVDARRLTRLRHQADVAVRSANSDQAVAFLCEAEALWRGPALAGLNGQWAAAMQTGLEDDRRNCILKRVALELDLGRHAELLSELRRLRMRYPDDEICAEHEMTALFRSGRQRESLEVYHQVRTSLNALGIEPGPRLSAHHRRILKGDLQQPEVPPKRLSPDRASHVRLRDTAFVGREKDMRKLTADGIDAPRVWVISGLPGIGKTRLAIEAAACLPGETLYLEFHANEKGQATLDADGALRCLLEMVGVDRSVLPRGRAELADLWQRELTSRQINIILDDVPDADAVAPLIPGDGSCRMFITSRNRLHRVPVASELTLDILPEIDAVTLFRQIAGTGNDKDFSVAARAVRNCGRLPIAIVIAAGGSGREGGLSASNGSAGAAEVGDMADQLQSVLDSSYRALTEDEQRFFLFLGINYCQSFTAESAAAVTGMSVHAAVKMISALFDRHLIEYAAGGGFKLHDLLMKYAAIRASRDVSGGERREAERRLLDHYLSRADRADRDLYPYRRRVGLQPKSMPSPRSSPDAVAYSRRWLDSEWRNVLAMAEYASRHERKRYCAELVHVLAEFLHIRGYWDEAVKAHGQALRACRDLGDRSRSARALIDLSRACLETGLRREALAHAREASELYRAVEDRRGEAVAADRIGVIYYHSGEFRETLAYEQEARSLYVQSADLAGEAEAVFSCGVACMELGRLSESLEHFRESMAIFERSGNMHSLARTLNSLGEVSRRQGYHRDAMDYYRDALSIYRGMGARQESATVVQNIGKLYLYKGDVERALAEFRCALSVFRQIHYIPGEARAMCDFGDAYSTMDDYEQSLIYYQKASSVAEQVGNLHLRLIAICGIADAFRGADRIEEAIDRYRDALEIARSVEDPYQQYAVALKGLAEAMLRVGKDGMGRIYLRQAYDLYQAAGAIDAESVRLRLQALGVVSTDENNLRAGLRRSGKGFPPRQPRTG